MKPQTYKLARSACLEFRCTVLFAWPEDRSSRSPQPSTEVAAKTARSVIALGLRICTGYREQATASVSSVLDEPLVPQSYRLLNSLGKQADRESSLHRE